MQIPIKNVVTKKGVGSDVFIPCTIVWEDDRRSYITECKTIFPPRANSLEIYIVLFEETTAKLCREMDGKWWAEVLGDKSKINLF